MPPINRFGFDGAACALDQAVGPGMIRLGEAVPDPATPTALGEWMDLGGAGPIPASLPSQRELPPVVGQHPIEVEGIEPLTMGQEGHGTGRISCQGDRHRHQPGSPIDGNEQISTRAAQTRQRKGIDRYEARGTGPEPPMGVARAGP